jgi:hypothetical protein
LEYYDKVVSQACELSGYDQGYLLQVIEVDGVDLKDDDQLVIDKLSLWEWLEVSLMLAHWND